jgi:2-dehydro-3-deoxyphosphogluconate aldolase/(4S)-4-hydroxy-2-oxoglutarate aldolase
VTGASARQVAAPAAGEWLLRRLTGVRLLAIVRGREPDAALAAALTLVDAGITAVEVSLTSDRALQVIEGIAARVDDGVTLGAGTVLHRSSVTRVRDAGARFIVTPCLAPAVQESRMHAMPVLCGALTPREVFDAVQAGAAAVKLFPVGRSGPEHLAALRAPFPATPFVPVGGVDEASLAAYARIGALAVGVGTPLLQDAADGGSLAELAARARSFIAAAEQAWGAQ